MYREIKPSIKLSESVEAFWVFSSNKSQEKFKIIPDTCTDLIFDLNQGNVFLSGVMSCYQLIEINTQSNLIGIRFKSENFGSLSQIPLCEVKNLTLELSHLFPICDFNVIRELESSVTLNEKIERLEVFITKALELNLGRKDQLIISVANRIRSLKGKLIIEDLAKFHNKSLRQLQRRFKQYVGLTLKEFSNIVRFENAERNIRANPESSLMQIAFNVGFYDHSHMNYEFQRIAGENPNRFR